MWKIQAIQVPLTRRWSSNPKIVGSESHRGISCKALFDCCCWIWQSIWLVRIRWSLFNSSVANRWVVMEPANLADEAAIKTSVYKIELHASATWTWSGRRVRVAAKVQILVCAASHACKKSFRVVLSGQMLWFATLAAATTMLMHWAVANEIHWALPAGVRIPSAVDFVHCLYWSLYSSVVVTEGPGFNPLRLFLWNARYLPALQDKHQSDKLTWVGCVEKPMVASYPKIVGSSPTVAPHCTAHLGGSWSPMIRPAAQVEAW